MIQRKQTIFLLLAAGAFASLFILPFGTGPIDAQGIFTDGKYSILDSIVLELLTGLGCLVALVNIFMFRKRPLQMKLGYAGITFSVFLLITTILIFTSSSGTAMVTEVDQGYGLLMPLLSIVFLSIALYYIREDEQLVKSMDRLR